MKTFLLVHGNNIFELTEKRSGDDVKGFIDYIHGSKSPNKHSSFMTTPEFLMLKIVFTHIIQASVFRENI